MVATEDLSRLFRPDPIDGETRAYNETLARNRATQVYELGAERTREARHKRWLAEEGPSPLAVDRDIVAPAGHIHLRVFVPDIVHGVYFHIHGGGFALGEACASDRRNEHLATTCNLAVLSADEAWHAHGGVLVFDDGRHELVAQERSLSLS